MVEMISFRLEYAILRIVITNIILFVHPSRTRENANVTDFVSHLIYAAERGQW